MGLASCAERSSSSPRNLLSKLSFSDEDDEKSTQIFDFSGTESSENESLPENLNQKLWPEGSLKFFSATCQETANDEIFDKLNNKLLIVLKQFSSTNQVYCGKCGAMKSVTKRGKTNKTYQFNCGNHTISAAQILSTLPDEFILEHIPRTPTSVYNYTMSWIGKDHLCPELMELSKSRKAVKRYGSNRSPIKGQSQTSILLKSRNAVNESLFEIKELKNRLLKAEQMIGEYSEQSNRHQMENDWYREQIRLLREENVLLKKYLAAPEKILPPKQTSSANENFASIAEIHRPVKASKPEATKKSALEIISKYEYKHQEKTQDSPSKPAPHQFSPLTMVFFEGCHKKSGAEYRSLLNQIGFPAHLARDIFFLAEDLLQITTFESEKLNLIDKLTAISPQVKHLENFNPTLAASYEKYGKLTNEQAASTYYKLMSQNANRIENESKRAPSLKRTALFFRKVANLKDFLAKPTGRVERVFCLGDFIKRPNCDNTETTDQPSEAMITDSQMDLVVSSQPMESENTVTHPLNESQ